MSKYINGQNIFFFLLSSFILANNYTSGPIQTPDSLGYINGHEFRPVLYPVFLDIMELLFGGDNYQMAVIISQAILWLSVSYYVSKELTIIFKISTIWIIILLLISSQNIFYSQYILSEAIAYPVFCLMALYLFKGVLRGDSKYLSWSMFFTGILILTRSQFLFLYSVFLVIFLYIQFFDRHKKHNKNLLIKSFLLLIISTTIIQKGYNYIKLEKFSSAPALGSQLIVRPLYLAQEDDYNLFTNKTHQKIFQETYLTIKKAGLTYNKDPIKKEIKIPDYKLFNGSLNDSNIMHPFLEDHEKSFHQLWSIDYKNEEIDNSFSAIQDNYIYTRIWATNITTLINNDITNWYQINDTSVTMAIILIKENFGQFLVSWIDSIILFYKGYLGTAIICLSFFGLMIYQYKKRDDISLAILAVFILSFANIFSVSLVEILLKRYSMYTSDFMLTIFCCITIKYIMGFHEFFTLSNNTQEPPTKVDGLIDGIKPDESGSINRFTENKRGTVRYE